MPRNGLKPGARRTASFLKNKEERRRKAKQSMLTYKMWGGIIEKMSVLFLSGDGLGRRENEASVTTLKRNKNQMDGKLLFLALRFLLKKTSSPVAVL